MKVVLYMLVMVMFSRPCKAIDNMKEIANYLFGGNGGFLCHCDLPGSVLYLSLQQAGCSQPYEAAKYGENIPFTGMKGKVCEENAYLTYIEHNVYNLVEKKKDF